MSQERLNRLAILSIEKNMLENLEYKNLISNFVSKKGEDWFLNKDIIILK